MADYAIHDTTLIGTSNVIRKKEGSSALIDPADYPKRINLMGMLEEKTASGAIVTFSDGADEVSLKSCEVALSASLDGYTEVDVVQTGKNLSSVSEYPNNPWYFWGTNFTDMVSFLNTLKSGTYSISFDFEVETVPDSGDIQYGLPLIRALVDGNYVNLTSYSISAASSVSVGDIFHVSASFTLIDEQVGNVSFCYIYCDRKDTHSGTGRGQYNLINAQVEVGSATTYEPYVAPTTHTASLGRTIYGGTADIVKGEGTDENGNDFTFEPVEINTRLGNNTIWSDGDMEVIYRASGTVTKIAPLLMSKAITANGTYTASDDNADGYDEVVVNVAGQEPTVTPLNSPNAFLTLSGVTGTDVERTVRTETAPSAGKYVFASDSTCRTNTGSGDGFFDIRKNDVSVVKRYMAANTTTPISIPEIEVETGDEVDIIVGFDNAHSSCNFQLYTGIAFVSMASASLLSMMPSEEVNENTEEVEENEQNESEG